ncbi:SARP family transcriptional regulator [Actinoplanes philippinensis]|uniref:DNA-binding transcriptional activator of the SARP family n=1 Tax=Actinoplanes philippinensis TaxID=35752 RepID=A0A1I2CHM2_9ACTN|nr:SARP family transcriptional regulator [Actinoplanes philippinensis]SFE67738.1 DNA-binding transcriptional activator of the SARP family [Actinoplanes philippinensis]
MLGPVSASVGDQPIPITRAQRRAVLAFLLWHANHAVTVTELIDALWETEPPATARTQVFAAVSAVRRALRAAGAEPVTSVHGGYRLDAGPAQLDLLAFGEAVTAAREHAARGDLGTAVTVLREGLALWTGPALGGVSGAWVEPARASLDDSRLTALEQLFAWELELGRHDAALTELTAAVTAAPLRERLAGLLMLALYRAGRQAEALAVYRRTHRLLVDEIGVEPGPELTALHQRVLATDETLRAPVTARPATPRRRFLPRDIPDFTGRGAELDHLDELTTDADLLVVGTVGVGGVGKSALAVHWGHRVADRFPDGQLYLNLRGYEERAPLRPAEALSALLGALGVPPQQVPSDVDGASALFRATLAGQRVLLLLDNARSAEQVRPLLPGSSPALVLVTSRDTLSGLIARDGARRLDLGLLPHADALALITRILGAQRVAAEPDAAGELVAVCGRLPLAVRIAAAHLSVRPEQSIAGYVAETRLDSLAIEGDPASNLRAVFDQSYRALTAGQQRVLRLLGPVPGGDVTAEAAAALSGDDPAVTEATLRALADASLLVEHRPDRFTLHDLTREYARSRTDATEWGPALGRLTGWLVETVESAVAVLHPGYVRAPGSAPATRFAGQAEARDWFAAELANIIAVITSGTALGCRDAVWRLAFACRFFFNGRLDGSTALALGRAAVEAAAGTGDLRARAAAELVMSRAYTTDAHDDRCRIHARRCLDLARDAGWHDIEADAHNSLSVHHMFTGELRLAAEHARRAFDLTMASGVVPPQYLGKVGLIMLLIGQLAEAADCFERTLASDNHRAGFSRAITLLNLAETRRLQGRYDEAAPHLDEAIGYLTAEGNHHLAALARADRAALLHRQGRRQEAWRMIDESRAVIARRSDVMSSWQITQQHAQMLIAAGRTAEAIDELLAAIDGVRSLGIRQPATQLQVILARAHADSDPGRAADLAGEAVAAARDGQFLLLEGQALTVLAVALRRLGRDAEALAAAKEALGVHEQTGHEPGREETAALLAELEGADRTGTPE